MEQLRLVQLRHQGRGRAVGVVREAQVRLVAEARSVYELSLSAIAAGRKLGEVVRAQLSDQALSYDEIYTGQSEWKLLPAFDHPDEPNRCLVTGTGLTHKASAENRQSMHGAPATAEETLTDSMRMYRIGLAGGRPKPGCVGAQPEWFYKGLGTVLRAHGQPLDVPGYGGDGGDEAEIAGCYVIADDGRPHRVGLVQGNEFSDHVIEAKNYLYLAHSKLRACSIGPELVVNADFAEVLGTISIERAGKTIWQGPLASGERWMCHTLANLEHHHFKTDFHRRPGDAHVHFLGADMFSFKDRLGLEDGDEMVIAFSGFGRPLRNAIRWDRSGETFMAVEIL